MFLRPLKRIVKVVWAAALATACGDSAPMHSGESSSSDATSSATDAASSTVTSSEESSRSTSEGTDPTTSSMDSSSSGMYPVPTCGDGVVEGDEECDDANDDPDDGCDALCNVSGIVEWTVNVDGPANGRDIPRAMAEAPNGDILVAGTITDGGATRVHLRWYAPDGSLSDAQTLGTGGESEQVREVAYDGSGALYVAGWTGAPDSDEAWLVKYDETLTETWRVVRPSEVDAWDVRAYTVALGPDEAVFFGGGLSRMGAAEHRDGWLVAVSAVDGAELWTSDYPGEEDRSAELRAASTTSDGSVVVVGYEIRSGLGVDGWIRKIDALGMEAWTVVDSGDGLATDESFADVEVDDDDTIVVAGGGSDPPTSSWIVTRRYTEGGELIWTRTYAGPEGTADAANAVALAPTGDVVVTTAVGVAGNGKDIFVRRYSGDGNFELWSSRYDHQQGNDVGRALTVGSDGAVYAAGEITELGTDANWWIRRYQGR